MPTKKDKAFSNIEGQLDRQNEEALNRIKALGGYLKNLVSGEAAPTAQMPEPQASKYNSVPNATPQVSEADLAKALAAKAESTPAQAAPQNEFMRAMMAQEAQNAQTEVLPSKLMDKVISRGAIESQALPPKAAEGNLLTNKEIPLKMDAKRFKKLFEQ